MSSFFEKLTGSHTEDETYKETDGPKSFMEEIGEDSDDAQLAVDVYQTPKEIIVQAVTPGMSPEDLDITLTHEMITLQGERKIDRKVTDDNFFYQELYWGTFSRSILLPQEIDPNEAEAEIKNGILTIKLPKLDKEKTSKIKVKK